MHDYHNEDHQNNCKLSEQYIEICILWKERYEIIEKWENKIPITTPKMYTSTCQGIVSSLVSRVPVGVEAEVCVLVGVKAEVCVPVGVEADVCVLAGVEVEASYIKKNNINKLT